MAQYGRDISTLSIDEILDELDRMLGFFVECRQLGQGISTKEGVYYRSLKARLGELDAARLEAFNDEEAQRYY